MYHFPSYALGQTLRVDLTRRKVESVDIGDATNRFVGGRGISSWLLFNELKPETGVYDPENLLIFSAGAAVGSDVPSSNRTCITSKNAFTGGINYSHAGGFFSTELKRAGVDTLIVTGKSDAPVYLFISDEGIQFKDAGNLWGKDTFETMETIRNELKDPNVHAALIGPAGENIVRLSCVIIDKVRACGAGGLGAIMGSKNLKAVAARGTKKVTIADHDSLEELNSRLLPRVTRSEFGRAMQKMGVHGAFAKSVNENCLYRTRNSQDDHWNARKLDKILFPALPLSEERFITCWNCPMNCSAHIYDFKEGQGPYAPIKMHAFQCNTTYWAPALDIDEPTALFKIFETLSRNGLDNDSTLVVLSWAFECYERGLLTEADTDGLELTWGDHAQIINLIHKITYRQGFGNLLAEGVKSASEKIGRGTDYYAIQIKGQDETDALRAAKGWALGIVTSVRGPRHLHGAPLTEFTPTRSTELSQSLFNIPTAYQPLTYEGKGKLVHWWERYKAAVDALGVCYYITWWGETAGEFMGPDELAEYLSAITGRTVSADEIMMIGKRIHNVEKAFNALHTNFDRKDDMPPTIYTKEPIKSGKYKGELLDIENWNKMLDEYYGENGWDIATGLQTKASFEGLGLAEVIQRLEKAGKL